MANAANAPAPGTSTKNGIAGTPVAALQGEDAVASSKSPPVPAIKQPRAGGNGKTPPRSKGSRSTDERHADRASVERMAAEVAAVSAEAKEAKDQAAAESSAREAAEAARDALAAELATTREAAETARAALEAQLATTTEQANHAIATLTEAANAKIAEAQAVVATMRADLSKPSLNSIRVLELAEKPAPERLVECEPPLTYTAQGNLFRECEFMVLGVQTWVDGTLMLRTRTPRLPVTEQLSVMAPLGPQTMPDGTVHDRFAVPHEHVVMVPVEGAMQAVAEQFVRGSTDKGGAHAIYMVIRPVLQVTDDAGRVRTAHSVFMSDLGAGTVATIDKDPPA